MLTGGLGWKHAHFKTTMIGTAAVALCLFYRNVKPSSKRNKGVPYYLLFEKTTGLADLYEVRKHTVPKHNYRCDKLLAARLHVLMNNFAQTNFFEKISDLCNQLVLRLAWGVSEITLPNLLASELENPARCKIPTNYHLQSKQKT